MADLLQFPLVLGMPVSVTADGYDSLERHLSLNWWRIFQFGGLTEVMRQRGDTKFIDLLNKIRAGNADEDVSLEETDTNYPENAFHMFAENYPINKHNYKMLNKLPDKMYIINETHQILC